MALLKSISGTRGTIGGKTGQNLTALDIVESTAAYAQFLYNNGEAPKVVLGRDARISGEIVSQIVSSTLRMMGVDVIDLGLSTTPTVEIAVAQEGAGGGIIVTASHNPKNWNALKFLNAAGEFISAAEGQEILRLANSGEVEYADVDRLGKHSKAVGYIQKHIDLIFGLELVNTADIKAKNYKVVVDCINSTGAISIVPLLEQLGCEVITINDSVNGRFAHRPEPLPENLTQLSKAVVAERADLGVAVDPDVDRLVFVCEDGEMFGEEYTLVAVADYVLQYRVGNTVSNLSSTQALAEVTKKHGGNYYAAAVGEVNVVKTMKEHDAVIGGEGNGGIIYPALHYGRDALVGVALFLSYLAESEKSVSILRKRYPNYVIIKDKIQLTPEIDIEYLLESLRKKYTNYPQNTIDGLKIFIDGNWIHLRKSNTEPIIRIYTESHSTSTAQHLANKIKQDVRDILKIKEL
ncbi:MAG: phosphoglucosamine mutase [Saprospiraceae bacterium]|nr:phosphoglucosamine mutase [Saprospiraceae bacterium]